MKKRIEKVKVKVMGSDHPATTAETEEITTFQNTWAGGRHRMEEVNECPGMKKRFEKVDVEVMESDHPATVAETVEIATFEHTLRGRAT